MDLLDFDFGLNAIATGGHILNFQERISIEAGMRALKLEEKLDNVSFWGKIFGQNTDYYFAYSLSAADFEFPAKSFYYATGDFRFKLLESLTEEDAARLLELAIVKPFVGDPEALLVQPVEGEEEEEAAQEEGEGEEEGQESKPVKKKDEGPPLKEIHRLAQVVLEIEFDTAVVPKGAFALDNTHRLVRDTDFAGLTLNKAVAAEKYVHFRPPASVQALRSLARNDVHFYSNFMDQLDGDVPKGCWVVRQEATGTVVTLRSLIWPGYVAFHAPNTEKFGGLYIGYGQKCRDLPFVL